VNRRILLKGGILAGISFPLLGAEVLAAPITKGKRAKNIIMMVSDGMSTGTLNMADLYASRILGHNSNWISLYKENKVVRALMDTASANSIVTDSAAASSAWGGGMRVKNGALNVGMKGETPQPILQKFKEHGKKVGCVTTVPITHATPAGFCINLDSRDGQAIIAEMYLPLKFDVMMGGGSKYFNSKRKDGTIIPKYLAQGYHIVERREDMMMIKNSKPVLGIFAEDALPFEIDRKNDATLTAAIPSLSEMAMKAIELMKDHKDGFVLQIEGGKVDWAAHSNDLGGLIFDQLAFDDTIGKVMEFAEKDGETLVIITTDHGNANPGLFYQDANRNFDRLQQFKHSNKWLLSQINQSTAVGKVMELIKEGQGIEMKKQDVETLLLHFKDVAPGQLYNDQFLPFEAYGKLLGNYTSVQWAGMDHSADHVELAAFGPGSELLKGFVKNYELHELMLKATEMPAHYHVIK
jgi:alkaline phosphatase